MQHTKVDLTFGWNSSFFGGGLEFGVGEADFGNTRKLEGLGWDSRFFWGDLKIGVGKFGNVKTSFLRLD